jgi:DNA-binding beta-propeller fold protein YncE
MCLAGAGVALLAAGCATHPTGNKGPKYVFFPPAPDEPRLQFLTAFGSERDLRGSGNSFLYYLTGANPDVNVIAKPYGAAVHQKKIYVCDTSYGVVLVLDLVERRMHGISPRGSGALKVPLNIAVDEEGTYYIADGGREQVVILDAAGHFVATVGQKGTNSPRDVVLSKDHIYVADIQCHCVHVYDKASRALQFDIPRAVDAAVEDRRLFQPTNLALDAQGRLYASDTGAYRVQVYDADGKYLRTVGHYGDNIGEFMRIKGVAVDREKVLYAVDAASQVVQMFDDQGRLLMFFGQPDASDVGLDLPTKVVVDYDNVGLFERYAAPGFKLDHLVIVINQSGPRKVSVFGFGQKK